jgi:hypothetical protein
MTRIRLFEESVKKCERTRRLASRKAEEADRNEWQMKLLSDQKLSIPSLTPAPTPLQTRSLGKKHSTITAIPVNTAPHFPSFPSRHGPRTRPSTQRGKVILSGEYATQAQEILQRGKMDMTSMEQSVDGVLPFVRREPDVRKIKSVTRPYSSITLFFDKSGRF